MSKETDAELMDQAIDDIDSVENHDDSLSASRGQLNDRQFHRLQTIGAFIMNGQSFEEACVLSHVDPENFKLLVEGNDFVRRYILVRETAYKASLTRVMVTDAMAGNGKIAGWLLERQYRQDFSKTGPSKREDDDGQHVLQDGLRFVRENGDAQPIVKALPAKDVSYIVREAKVSS